MPYKKAIQENVSCRVSCIPWFYTKRLFKHTGKFWYPHLQWFQRSTDNCGKLHVQIILGHPIHIASAQNKIAILQTSLLISGDCVTRLVLFHGPKSLRHIFYINLVRTFWMEWLTRTERAENRACVAGPAQIIIIMSQAQRPSDRDIPGNQENLQVKVLCAHHGNTSAVACFGLTIFFAVNICMKFFIALTDFNWLRSLPPTVDHPHQEEAVIVINRASERLEPGHLG